MRNNRPANPSTSMTTKQQEFITARPGSYSTDMSLARSTDIIVYHCVDHRLHRYIVDTQGIVVDSAEFIASPADLELSAQKSSAQNNPVVQALNELYSRPAYERPPEQ